MKYVIGCVFVFFICQTQAVQCEINTVAVQFGQYDPFAKKANDSTGSLDVECSGNVAVTAKITLSTGQSGNYNTRFMGNGEEQLHYNLYQDRNHSLIWGNGSGNSHAVIIVVDSRKGFRQKIYGEIPQKQDVMIGQYTDQIVATVEY